MDIKWSGTSTDEIGIDSVSGKTVVKIDPRYFRPAEVELLLADPSKAKRVLGWQATTLFDDLVKEMMEYDMSEAAKLV